MLSTNLCVYFLPSTGGDSKTLMFVQISPNENDLSETLCSLNFASRVRGIELGPAKKQVENNELLRCKQMVLTETILLDYFFTLRIRCVNILQTEKELSPFIRLKR